MHVLAEEEYIAYLRIYKKVYGISTETNTFVKVLKS